MNAPFQPVSAPDKARLRIEDFMLLDAHGAFDSYRKTELIGGEVVYMNAQYRPHARVKAQLARAIEAALAGTAWTVLIEASVSLPPDGLPEPDIVLTNEPEGDGPVPGRSVGLLVEVADSTLAWDLGRKAEEYAAAGIPEYWVADIANRQLHQMWVPTATGYAERGVHPFGSLLGLATFATFEVRTDSLG